MNTFIKKIYFFSKLSTSIILLLFVIFLSYLLLLSYQGNSRKEIEINSFIDPIKLKIEKNATKYETESNKVLLKLDSLDTKTKNIENEISDINQIVDNFIEIKNQIILLQNKVNEINVSNLYQEENDYNQSPVQFKEKNKLKNIIITKFKNNLNYMDELDLLESLSDKSKKPIFEKLILMSAKKFIGVEELKKKL